MKKKNTILILVLLSNFFVFGQSEMGQLNQELSQTNDLKLKTTILEEMANYYLRKNGDSVLYYGRLLEKNARKLNDSLVFGKAYYKMAQGFFYKSNYNETFNYGKKAISIFDSSNKPYLSAQVKRTLGNTSQILYKNQEAISYLTEANTVLEGKDKILIYIGLGTVYSQLNDLKKASENYNAAYNLSKSLNYDKYTYDIFNALAVLYDKNNDKEETINYLKKALNAAKKNDYNLGQLVALHNLGYQYKKHQDYTLADLNYKKALRIIPETNNKYMIASTYMNYAENQFYLNQLDEASLYLNKSEKLYKEMNNEARIADVLNKRAAIENKKGRTKKAIATLETSLKKSKRNNIYSITSRNYFDLSQLYEKENRYKDAMFMFKQYTTIKDSISKIKKTEEIESLKIKSDIDEIEKDLKKKNIQLKLLNTEHQASNYRNILFGIIIVGLIYFFYRNYKLNKIKKKLSSFKEAELEEKMKFKNKEITNYAIQINERNKLLEDFNTKLSETKKSNDLQKIKNEIRALQSFIINNIATNKEKIILNTDVKQTEESFLYNLKNNYPKLSPREEKVATYLRLNLSSKQIGSHLNITPQTVNNYRLSIRKKFNIPKSVNIVDYLMKI